MDDTDIQQEIAKLQAELKQREASRADVIQDHVDAARAGTPSGTSVRQQAFEHFLQAFEKLYVDLKNRKVFENEEKTGSN